MLIVQVPGTEFFDNVKQEFVYGETENLKLEHSLVTISQWESKWEKPFLSSEKKTDEETVSYIQIMCQKGDSSVETLSRLSDSDWREINKYIESKMTATWFNEPKSNFNQQREVITSEIIYFWMTSFNIPFECERWHLNRLITLIKTINQKNIDAQNSSKKKAPTRSSIDERRALNEARRKQYNTTG